MCAGGESCHCNIACVGVQPGPLLVQSHCPVLLSAAGMFVVARSPTNPALLHLPQDKGIGSIDIIRNYPHLQVVEMPGNSIKDISALSALAHVRRVNFRGNNLTEVLSKCARGQVSLGRDLPHAAPAADFQPEPFEDNFAEHEFRVIVGSALEDADLSDNKIEEIEDLSHHRCASLLLLKDGVRCADSGGCCVVPAMQFLADIESC